MVEQIALDGGGDNSIRSQGGRQENFVGSNGDGDDRHSSGSLRHTKESVADIKEAEEDLKAVTSKKRESDFVCWQEPYAFMFHFYDEENMIRVDPGFGRVHHDCYFRRNWDALTVVALCYMSLTLPVFVALDISTPAVEAIATIIDILFILDLILNFFTTFNDEDALLVTDYELIGWVPTLTVTRGSTINFCRTVFVNLWLPRLF